jgi:hypothetical protein
MDIQLPQEFVLRREVSAIQLFGRSLLERIPPNAVILADRPAAHVRMIEAIWKEKRYIVFLRDLEERAEAHWNSGTATRGGTNLSAVINLIWISE